MELDGPDAVLVPIAADLREALGDVRVVGLYSAPVKEDDATATRLLYLVAIVVAALPWAAPSVTPYVRIVAAVLAIAVVGAVRLRAQPRMLPRNVAVAVAVSGEIIIAKVTTRGGQWHAEEVIHRLAPESSSLRAEGGYLQFQLGERTTILKPKWSAGLVVAKAIEADR